MKRSIIEDERSNAMQLSSAELQRYSRHLMMPEVTPDGQRRLKAARVLCIGAGGLGSPAAVYLAAAGMGTIGIVDFDDVDLSNLQRQILHGTKDVGRDKLESARDRLHDINPEIDVQLHKCRFSSENAPQLVSRYDVIVDGSDNFPTRYDSVPNGAQAGVLGVLPGIIGMLQAIEAIKMIVGVGESLVGRLLHFDALKARFRELNLRRDPECPVCGENPTIFSPIDYEQFCGARDEEAIPTMSAHELKQKMDAREPFELIDVREGFEYEIARIDGARLIPLGEIAERADELPRDRPIVVHCHSGRRSAEAVRLLQQRGFGNIYNLEGGIDGWSDQIDPGVPKY